MRLKCWKGLWSILGKIQRNVQQTKALILRFQKWLTIKIPRFCKANLPTSLARWTTPPDQLWYQLVLPEQVYMKFWTTAQLTPIPKITLYPFLEWINNNLYQLHEMMHLLWAARKQHWTNLSCQTRPRKSTTKCPGTKHSKNSTKWPRKHYTHLISDRNKVETSCS